MYLLTGGELTQIKTYLQMKISDIKKWQAMKAKASFLDWYSSTIDAPDKNEVTETKIK